MAPEAEDAAPDRLVLAVADEHRGGGALDMQQPARRDDNADVQRRKLPAGLAARRQSPFPQHRTRAPGRAARVAIRRNSAPHRVRAAPPHGRPRCRIRSPATAGRALPVRPAPGAPAPSSRSRRGRGRDRRKGCRRTVRPRPAAVRKSPLNPWKSAVVGGALSDRRRIVSEGHGHSPLNRPSKVT